MSKSKVTGLEEVMRNLDKEVRKIEGGSQRGVTRAALLIGGDAAKNAPVVTGNLRASRYTVSKTGGSGAGNAGEFSGPDAGAIEANHSSGVSSRQSAASSAQGPYAETGFTAFYAGIVHENPNAGGGAVNPNVPAYKRKSEVGGPKFLQNSVSKNKSKILQIVAKDAKIK